jgi:hypothetical protein
MKKKEQIIVFEIVVLSESYKYVDLGRPTIKTPTLVNRWFTHAKTLKCDEALW